MKILFLSSLVTHGFSALPRKRRGIDSFARSQASTAANPSCVTGANQPQAHQLARFESPTLGISPQQCLKEGF